MNPSQFVSVPTSVIGKEFFADPYNLIIFATILACLIFAARFFKNSE